MIKNDELTNYEGRAYALKDGDIFWANDEWIQLGLNTTLKDVAPGKEVVPRIYCIEKTKRKHWWQFWKPKYTGASFMYIEQENSNEY